MGLTSKQAKFVEAYKKLNNSHQAAISAGYSAKSAQIEGCRLLKNPTILQEIAIWKKSRQELLPKEDFIDLALNDYRALEVTEANKPRFLDIAGKALGYIGANNDQKNAQTINNTQININIDTNQVSLWDSARKLLEQ